MDKAIGIDKGIGIAIDKEGEMVMTMEHLATTVQQLANKVEYLEEQLKKANLHISTINTSIRRGTSGNNNNNNNNNNTNTVMGSRKKCMLTRLNGLLNDSSSSEGDGRGEGAVVPSMNIDTFIAYLANMPCDVERVVDKNSAEVIVDLVADGLRHLLSKHQQQEQGFVAPIASFTDHPGALYMFGHGDLKSNTDKSNAEESVAKWRLCTPDMFSRFVSRVHACVGIQCNRWREKNVGPPRPLFESMVNSNGTENSEKIGGEGKGGGRREPRDPRTMAKYQKISVKIYSINLDSVGLMARTKKLLCGLLCN